MKAFTNTDIIETRAKWAKRVAPLTMVFLVGGLITNFMSFNQPEYFRYTVILLAIGFILSLVSSHLVNNWVREPRSDQTLLATLKKFGNDYVLFNYTSLAPHLLLTPSRLYVLVVRRQGGEVRVKGNRFSRPFSFIRILKFFTEEGLGVPNSEAQSHLKKLQKLLSQHLENEAIPELQALVIFTNKDVSLILDEPALPVIAANQLKSYLRDRDKTKNISATTRNQLITILGNEYPEAKSK
jgi:hypothetical protein